MTLWVFFDSHSYKINGQTMKNFIHFKHRFRKNGQICVAEI